MTQFDRTVALQDRGLLVTDRGLHRGCSCCGGVGGPCCATHRPCPPNVVDGRAHYLGMISGDWEFEWTIDGFVVDSGLSPASVTTAPHPTAECEWCNQIIPTSGSLIRQLCMALRRDTQGAGHWVTICNRTASCGIPPFVVPPTHRPGIVIQPPDIGAKDHTVYAAFEAGSVGEVLMVANRSSSGVTAFGGALNVFSGIPDKEYIINQSLDVQASFSANGCCTEIQATWNLEWDRLRSGSRSAGFFSGSGTAVVQYSDCPESAPPGPGDGIPDAMKQGANFNCLGCGQ